MELTRFQVRKFRNSICLGEQDDVHEMHRSTCHAESGDRHGDAGKFEVGSSIVAPVAITATDSRDDALSRGNWRGDDKMTTEEMR